MDNQSAIQILKDFDSQVSVKADGAYQTTVGKMACDLAVAALEKQIPKKIIIKPVKNEKLKNGSYVNYICPICKILITSGYYYPPCSKNLQQYKFCSNCGQAIDCSD